MKAIIVKDNFNWSYNFASEVRLLQIQKKFNNIKSCIISCSIYNWFQLQITVEIVIPPKNEFNKMKTNGYK